MVEHHFFLAVTPKAAARMRCACRGKGARAFPTIYPAEADKAWLNEVLPKLELQDPMLDPEQRRLPARISVEVRARKPKTSKLSAPRGDLDNYEKGLWDAMTKAGKWWVDDTQIVGSMTTKRWAADDEPEGYKVEVLFG